MSDVATCAMQLPGDICGHIGVSSDGGGGGPLNLFWGEPTNIKSFVGEHLPLDIEHILGQRRPLTLEMNIVI